MFLISPSHSISLSLSNLDSLGRYFILAYYPSFYLNGGLSNLLKDSLNQSYLLQLQKTL